MGPIPALPAIRELFPSSTPSWTMLRRTSRGTWETTRRHWGASLASPTSSGSHWTPWNFCRVFANARKVANEAVGFTALPAEATAYMLRHTAITRMLVAGFPAAHVAEMTGTSLAMLDLHYGHLYRHDLARVAEQLG